MWNPTAYMKSYAVYGILCCMWNPKLYVETYAVCGILLYVESYAVCTVLCGMQDPMTNEESYALHRVLSVTNHGRRDNARIRCHYSAFNIFLLLILIPTPSARLSLYIIPGLLYISPVIKEDIYQHGARILMK